jgi:hypothetical protein
LLAFGVGMMIGNAMDDDDYCYPHWGSGSVYYGGRPFYPPAYAYRPVYGPAFRPAVGYAPSAGYRNRYNSPTNVVINNNNYYNRFDNQQNLRVNNSRGSGPGSRQAGAGNRSTNAGRSQDWKGQSSYAGGRGGASSRDAPTAKRGSSAPDRKTASTGRKSAAPQPATGQRSTGRSQTQARPTTQPNDRSGGGRDRGYGTSAPSAGRDVASTTRQPTPDVSSREAPEKRDNALSGASQQGTGSFDRAASARGHASAPASRERSSRGGGRKP